MNIAMKQLRKNMSAISEDHIYELTKFRQQLHSIAEVSGQEKETAATVAKFLKSTEPDEIITGLGGYGIVARYRSGREGPAILLRCELDALPIADESDVEYRSRNQGVGHKCGHDGHMAILGGVAKSLGAHKPVSGEVMLLFQPAEETGQGAAGILSDKRFSGFNPDYVFALHNLPGFPLHQIIIKQGVFTAASVGFVARFKGSTSHAAHPEQGQSPALAMAQLIETLSAIPQLYTPLARAAQATVVHARLGNRSFGTSPGEAEVMATLRAYDDDTLHTLKIQAESAARRIATVFDLDVGVEWVESFPATHNDSEAVDLLKQIAHSIGLHTRIVEDPFGWSEDFGHFTKRYPGALFGLGAGVDQPVLHAPNYDFPDAIIESGVSMFLGIIGNLTGSGDR